LDAVIFSKIINSQIPWFLIGDVIMPVEFLTAEQESKYGKFSDEPTSEQLAKYFLLDDYDNFFIFRYKGDHNHLGIALQLIQ